MHVTHGALTRSWMHAPCGQLQGRLSTVRPALLSSTGIWACSTVWSLRLPYVLAAMSVGQKRLDCPKHVLSRHDANTPEPDGDADYGVWATGDKFPLLPMT